MTSVRRTAGTIVWCALVATLAAGCTTWRVQWVSPETVVRRDQPKAVAVTLVDSSLVVLDKPRIVGDSMVGKGVDGALESIALTEVAYVAVKRADGAGTAGWLLLGSVAALLGIAAAVAASF